jgi:hypothetical protein
VGEFERKLNEFDADFSIELINSIYANVTRMLPEYFKQQAKEPVESKKEGSHFIKGETFLGEDEI